MRVSETRTLGTVHFSDGLFLRRFQFFFILSDGKHTNTNSRLLQNNHTSKL